MNKSPGVIPNSPEGLQKGAPDPTEKGGPTPDSQSDTHSEDLDIPQEHSAKTTSHFDCSNLSLFFSNRTPQAKVPADSSIGKPYGPKKSFDRSSSKEKNAQKNEFSNLDELVENTTIIRNPTENNAHSKTKSTEVYVAPKNKADDVSNELLQAMSLENALFSTTKKSIDKSYSSLLKTPKEEKGEQDQAADISNLGFNMDDDQDELKHDSFDIKGYKIDTKVLDRVRSRALLNSHSSFSANIFETPKTPDGSQSEPHTNNSSIFASTSVSKLAKAVSPIILQYHDKDIYNDDTNDQDGFITELFGKKNTSTEEIPLDKSKEIYQNGMNQKPFVPEPAREIRKKATLSFINTDSTFDSENFAMHQDPQNNSFSTHFSGGNASCNGSGKKVEFPSPVKIDSERINSDTPGNYGKGYHKNMNGKMPMMGSQKNSTNMNQTFCGGFAGGNNSDRNNSFNNEEYISNFNTPQGNQQQNYRNQGFNMSHPNMMEQFFIAPPSLAESTLMPQSPATPEQKKKNNNQNDKNARMRRKNQDGDDGDQFEIDLDRIESCGRTTLMVRNIPNKYDLTLILQTIDKNHKGKFDFFYLPIDFSNRCNFGYAFINFSSTKAIKDFYNDFNGKKWEKFNSEKICEIKYARIQGHAALMQHFQYSRVMNQQDKKLRPYIPTKYGGLQNKQKIEELVRQQKLAISKDGKVLDSVRNYKESYHY